MLEGDDAGSAAVYACGPPAMLEAVRALCAERGRRLRAGDGVADGLRLRRPASAAPSSTSGGYMRLCVDGPIVRGEQVETALVAGAGH